MTQDGVKLTGGAMTGDPGMAEPETRLHVPPTPSYLTLPKYVSCSYEPKPDITAYELAIILPFFMGGHGMTEKDWEALGDARRHLRRRE